MGWLVVGLVALSGLLAGALAWAVRERRLRGAAEVERDLLQQHLGVATRSLEARDLELSSLRCALILAQQELRQATTIAEVAAVEDPEVPGALVAALADLRARRLRGQGGGDAAIATSPTLDDLPAVAAGLTGLAAREAAGGSGRGGAS